MARFLFAFVIAALIAGPASAAGRQVRWTKVEVRSSVEQPDEDRAKTASRVARTLEKLLVKASRKAKWGKGDRLELTARVTKLVWEEHDDVLRVTVTVVARIKGGESARSHIRLGGRPKERRSIEKDALEIVAGGLVTRLSDIARRRAEAAPER